MKEQFKTINLRPQSLTLLADCNRIIEEYLADGLRLTLRQLYYQLVTKNIITNQEKSYNKLSDLVSDGRLAGLLDWNAIEDRTRLPHTCSEWDDLASLVNSAIYSYRLPRWDGQENYVELWVEKDALAGVLAPLASQYHVTLMVNRGYSSQSAMYMAAKRFKEKEDKHGVLLYLGDHDPSGEDMVRDIRDRLEMFNVRDLDVQKVALTMTQIKKYDPPPNPAKVSDPRAQAYIEKFGNSSWEVDALPPKVLSQLITTAFKSVVDMDKMQTVIEQENSDKEWLVSLTKNKKRGA